MGIKMLEVFMLTRFNRVALGLALASGFAALACEKVPLACAHRLDHRAHRRQYRAAD